MPFKTDSDWAKNKKSPDIIYTFVDCQEVRYHKEDGHIYEITTINKKSRRTRRLPASEMSIKEFDALKKLSDDSFHDEDNLEVNAWRGRIPLEDVENTIAASREMYEKREPNLDDALAIVEKLDLTSTQRRRFLLSIRGLTLEEIAAIEGAHISSVHESLAAVRHKRDHYFKKILD